MPISPYLRELRSHVGSARLLLPSVSVHIFDDQGRLLLVEQRESRVWSTPGGMIEPDERPADAAMREAWEEMGVLVRVERLLGVFGGPDCVVHYPNGDEAQYIIAAFGCVIESGDLQPDGDETTAARFWSFGEAKSLRLSHWLREALPRVYDVRGGVTFEAPTWRPPMDAG